MCVIDALYTHVRLSVVGLIKSDTALFYPYSKQRRKAVNQNLECLHNSKTKPKAHQAANLEEKIFVIIVKSKRPKRGRGCLSVI